MNVPARKIAPPTRSRERIGADRARVWVREITLKNPYAKSIMLALANYMNEDGTAFPGVETLARDTDINEDTVVSRLRWLESIGMIAMVKAWVDANGNRNHDGVGRVTSNSIRLLIDADVALIEERAAGDRKPTVLRGAAAVSRASRADDISSRQHGELNDDDSYRQHGGQNEGGSGLAPGQPPTPSARIEEYQEDSPPTPQAGGGDDDQNDHGQEKVWPHAETWARFEAAWVEPIIHQERCRSMWTAFTDDERERAITVARGYVKWRTSQKRPPNACNAQKILREREAWAHFEKHAGPDPALRVFIAEDSVDYTALRIVGLIIGILPPLTQFDVERGVKGCWWKRGNLPADLKGLAIFADKPFEQFTPLEPDTQPFKAWAKRIHTWIGRWPETASVPCLWPPLKDGSIGRTSPDVKDANPETQG